MLLRRLPVKNPDQLVLFNGARNHYGNNSGGNMLSFPMYEDFRDDFVEPRLARRALAARRAPARVANGAPAHKIFSGMFARRPIAMNVGVDGQTERVPGELVSGTYFQVLGVGAAIGRVITARRRQARTTARSRCSATTTGAPASAPIRRSSARRSRSTTTS